MTAEFRFGSASLQVRENAHPELQDILDLGLLWSPVDFGLSESFRTFEKQLEYFESGASTLDPRDPDQRSRAKHLRYPADAVDIYIWVPGKPKLRYDPNHLCLVAGVLLAAAEHLRATGKIKSRARWGGNWDGDQIIIVDQNFDDLPHIERDV